MKRLNKSAIIIAVLLAASGLVSVLASRPSVRALTSCTTSTAGLDSAESELAALINQTRANAGLTALSISGSLNRAAAWKSEDPSASPPLSHTDSLGRSQITRVLDCDYPSSSVGEIIAWGFSSPQSVHDAWMNSSGHRSQILGANYVVMGLGRSGSSWTVNFGFIADGGSSGSAPAPTVTAAPTQQLPPPTATPTGQSAPPAPSATTPSTQRTSVFLSAGFNFVTYAGQRRLTERAFDSLGGVELWVYGWNDQAHRWDRFFRPAPDYLNTLVSLEPGRAYMIWVSQPAFWEY